MQDTSLMHKIFKAKYFPKGRFLELKLRNNPSFIWRGIWEVKKSMALGCIWRVGNGRLINVWIDYWIPECMRLAYIMREDEITNHNATVEITNHNVTVEITNHNATVDRFIDPHTKWCDIEKVRSMLPVAAASEVLKLNLGSSATNDLLI